MGVLSWIWSLVAASAPEEQPNESAMPKPPETSLPSADPGTWQTDADKLYGPRSEDFARRRQAVAVLRSLGRWYYEQHQNMRMAICCYMRALYHLQYWPTAPSTRPPSEEERSTLTTDSALLHLGLGIFHMKTSEREHLKGSQEGSKAACRRALSLPAAAARRHLDTALRLWGDGESNPVPAQAAGEQPEQAHNPNKDKAKVLAWRARAHMALGSPDAASADAAAAAKLSRDPGVRKVFTEVLEAKRQSERLKKHQAAAAHDHHGPPVPRETCWARFKEDLRCRVVDWIDDYLGERLADPDPELVASRKEAAHLAEVASRPEL